MPLLKPLYPAFVAAYALIACGGGESSVAAPPGAGGSGAADAGPAPGNDAAQGDSALPPGDARKQYYCSRTPPPPPSGPERVVWTQPAHVDRFGDLFGPADFGAVWIDGRLLVWGGDQLGTFSCPGAIHGSVAEGAIYEPVAGTWDRVSSAGAPLGRHQPRLFWTGDSLILWGGFDDPIDTLTTGGVYDVARDEWRPISNDGAPPDGCRAITVWTGQRLLVWLGEHEGYLYDPAADRWAKTTEQGSPTGGDLNGAWTGIELVTANTINFLDASDIFWAHAYDPEGDAWRQLAPPPLHISGHRAFWTGAHVLFFSFESAALYDPCHDSWRVLSGVPDPVLADYQSLWTASQLVLWGYEQNDATALAYRYDPYLETSSSQPDLDRWFTAVWTGNEILVPLHHPP